MKNKIKIICLALAMAVMPVTGNALADKHKITPYAGMGFGQVKFDTGDGVESDAWAPSIFGGAIVHPNLGVEAGAHWASTGLKTRFNVPIGVPGASFQTVNSSLDTSLNTFYIAAIGKYKLADDFTVYAKAGLHRWKAEVKSSVSDILVGPSTPQQARVSLPASSTSLSSVDPMFGLGAQYDLSENASVRLEWGRYKIDEKKGTLKADGDFDIVGVQMLYRF